MNFLTFDHSKKKSWIDIAPDLAKKHELSTEIKEPVILHTTDPCCNYIIGSMGEEIDMKRKMYDELHRPDYEKFDFNVCNEQNKEIADVANKHDHIPSMSFFAINNIEDGRAWYEEKYPDMPELVIETACRYTWGDPPAEKSRKKKVAKINEKRKQKDLGINRGEFTLDFN
jgi:hypothetical protein